MTDYQKAKRPDLAILDVLSKCVHPAELVELYAVISPSNNNWISLGALSTWAERLVSDGSITRSYHPRGSVPVYEITVKGRAHLIAADTQSVIQEPIAPAPDEYEPAIAMLCVDEDELDKWWKALEVEAKADAFMQWSLGSDGRNSHIYIEPHETTHIPVAGTIGEGRA